MDIVSKDYVRLTLEIDRSELSVLYFNSEVLTEINGVFNTSIQSEIAVLNTIIQIAADRLLEIKTKRGDTSENKNHYADIKPVLSEAECDTVTNTGRNC